MMKTTLARTMTVCALSACIGIARAAAPETAAIAKPGSPAPAFTLPDLAGTAHALETFKGSYVVLEWVNHDCPFVRKHYETGRMGALQRQLAGEGVVWLSIGSSAPGKQGHFTPEVWKERMAKVEAAPRAVLLDADGKVGRLYGAKTTPHLFVIDPQGGIVYAGAIDNQPGLDRGVMDQAVNYVAQALAEARAGKPVSVPATDPYGCSVKY